MSYYNIVIIPFILVCELRLKQLHSRRAILVNWKNLNSCSGTMSVTWYVMESWTFQKMNKLIVFVPLDGSNSCG